MTICQFYLQGRCRFGQNCRFEHSYNNDDRSNRNAASTQQLSNAIKQIVDQVVLAEKGGQWPLSCFSPVKEGTNIPGWEDISPEEVRWKMYDARTKGTLNQCINEINQLYSNAEKNRNFLKQPTMERVNLIVNVLKGKKDICNASNPFTSSSTNIFGSTGQATSPQRNVFGGATQSSGNIFGGSSQLSPTQGCIFGNSTQTAGAQRNIFGGSTSGFSNKNIFGGSTSPSSFNPNVFGSSQPANQNIFSSSSPTGGGNIFAGSQNSFSFSQTVMKGTQQSSFSPTITSAVFSNKSPSTPIFGSQNAFFQNPEQTSSSQPNIFGGEQSKNIFKSQSSFGNSGDVFKSQPDGNVFGTQSASTNQLRPNAMDSSVYSKVEDLSEDEIKCFTAPTFAFGKIPLKPPPQEYCN